WSVGPIDFSGYLDGYYSYNANRPSNAFNGQINDLYNFNDKTDQFNLSAAKLTINHDADPIGVHADLIFGRTNVLIHPATDKNTDNYLEQAFISFKPAKSHGSELDFGQFVTSAGAEVIEAKDDWNYSRSLLFAWAIPYYHFGLRTSLPATKTWTVGLQVVNGWNDVVANNGGVTIGLTSALVKPKYSWFVNYYTGPQNFDTQKGYRNLIDTTLLLTPTAKFSAYLNYDYGQNKTPASTVTAGETTTTIPSQSPHWQGIAFAAHQLVGSKSSLTGRYEYFVDNQGFETGTAQTLQEFTGTYEYKWLEGLLTRVEYRRDWSDNAFFHKGDSTFVKAQSTATVAFIAFFGPKR
ncbi:MAG TPA: porin, partial [Acidobacteriaceae bacterium]|nr:porin [Acidobacteriaceae bacterium]